MLNLLSALRVEQSKFESHLTQQFNAEILGIRGEHITIVPESGLWSGTVIHTENLGADSYVYLEMGTEEPVVVRLDGSNTYNSGDVVQISPMNDKIHRFNAAGKPIA